MYALFAYFFLFRTKNVTYTRHRYTYRCSRRPGEGLHEFLERSQTEADAYFAQLN